VLNKKLGKVPKKTELQKRQTQEGQLEVLQYLAENPVSKEFAIGEEKKNTKMNRGTGRTEGGREEGPVLVVASQRGIKMLEKNKKPHQTKRGWS